jgi:putative NADH-flavin reductase
MNITIFGATGGTGRCLTEQAVAAGHQVTVVVRDPARLAVPAVLAGTAGPRLRVITADIMDPAAIRPAVAGAEAVLSAVGPHGTGRTTVSQDSVRAIIAAMQESGARRLLTISGSVVTDAGEGPLARYLLKPAVRAVMLRNVCADMRRAEEEVRGSGLDWTIIRPPRLTGRAATGRYRTAVDRNLPGGYTISRADLAACMLALLGDDAAVRKHIAIAN